MSSSAKKKPAMGKGLSALLSNAAAELTSKTNETAVPGAIAMLPIEQIEANPFNPRTHFEEEALNELSASIAVHGIIQPLTVRKINTDKYQLISGERRFRASQMAGLTEVPAYIRVANDQTMLEMALVENIQREDLNAIEVALSYQRLIDECNLTQEQMSQKIAKSRSSITNHLRLLKLPDVIQLGVRDNTISMGHARALVSAGDQATQLALYQRILNEQLSVRELEQLLRDGTITAVERKEKKEVKTAPLNKQQSTFQSFLGDRLSTKVAIKKTAQGSGSIQINFASDVDLNRIIELLSK